MVLIKKLFFALCIIFSFGSGIFFTVDTLSPTTYDNKSQIIRTINIEYWNAIGGASVIIITYFIVILFISKLQK
jgi:hypothetical protein